MAIATRAVTINAAFLQEIKDDHHELRQLMHHAAAMLDRPSWMSHEYGRLVELFSKLRDQLAMHFSLEEAYGYFEDAIGEAPHLNRRAEQLRAEHFELYSRFCSLVDAAEQLLYHEESARETAGLARSYFEFATKFHEHESRESALVLEALTDDLGAGD